MSDKIVDLRNQISTEELACLVRHQLGIIEKNPEMSAQLPPLMVWGAPGIGKSTILRQAAEEAGIGFIDIRLAQREPVDLRGLPVPDGESVKWLVSSDWPRDPGSRGLLLFDELTAADRTIQVAAYELILDRRLGDLYKVPDGWYIVAAGNRDEDMAVATTMSSALANRFMHVELRENIDDWAAWGMRNDIHPAVIGFLRYRPELLFRQQNENLERGWPTPRSWARVSTLLKTAGKDISEELLSKLVAGLVGPGAGSEFVAFKAMSADYDDVRETMLDPEKSITIPERPDRKYAYCSSVAYHLWRGRNAKEQALLLDGFFRIVKALPHDFGSMLMMDAMTGNRRDSDTGEFAGLLISHPMFKEWEQDNKAFMKRIRCK